MLDSYNKLKENDKELGDAVKYKPAYSYLQASAYSPVRDVLSSIEHLQPPVKY